MQDTDVKIIIMETKEILNLSLSILTSLNRNDNTEKVLASQMVGFF